MGRDELIDTGSAESEQFEPDDDVKQEFYDAQRLGAGSQEMIRELRKHYPATPGLSGGDLDARWDGEGGGEETVGGSAPTPDQDIVEELGAAVGITYQDNEPLHTTDKIEQRDLNRWELDPASSDDYDERVNREGE